MKINALSLFFALGIIFTLFTSSMRDPNNPPTGKTGAPGETTCAQSSCHSGGAFTGTVTITGVPQTAIFGQVYPLTVTNTSNAIRAGFQLTCLDSLNAKCGTLSTATGVSVANGNSRQYARQSQPKNLSGGSTSWTFNWTAPATVIGNKATFYFVSLCSNSNGQKTGDNVLVSSKPFVLALTSATEEVLTSADIKLFPTQVADVLHVELMKADQGYLSIFTTAGRLMFEKSLVSSNVVALDQLNAGTYLARIQTSAGSVVKKFVKI